MLITLFYQMMAKKLMLAGVKRQKGGPWNKSNFQQLWGADFIFSPFPGSITAVSDQNLKGTFSPKLKP
jgi:hypothetical protein